MFRAVQDEEVQCYFTSHQIRWKYIVERVAWWGGFWELLARTMKVSLQKVLGRSSLNFKELATVLREVEAVINSRPLTFLYHNTHEPETLPPAHFLVGRRPPTPPPTAGKVKQGGRAVAPLEVL